MREISFVKEGKDDEEKVLLSNATLKGSRENSLLSLKNKHRFNKLEDKVKRLSKEP